VVALVAAVVFDRSFAGFPRNREMTKSSALGMRGRDRPRRQRAARFFAAVVLRRRQRLRCTVADDANHRRAASGIEAPLVDVLAVGLIVATARS
jgi:hypothetical protein